MVNNGKKKYLQTGLNDHLSNSASTWRGVKAHLGWETQVGPEALVVKRKDDKASVEKLVTKPSKVAEVMVQQYESKK